MERIRDSGVHGCLQRDTQLRRVRRTDRSTQTMEANSSFHPIGTVNVPVWLQQVYHFRFTTRRTPTASPRTTPQKIEVCSASCSAKRRVLTELKRCSSSPCALCGCLASRARRFARFARFIRSTGFAVRCRAASQSVDAHALDSFRHATRCALHALLASRSACAGHVARAASLARIQDFAVAQILFARPRSSELRSGCSLPARVSLVAERPT